MQLDHKKYFGFFYIMKFVTIKIDFLLTKMVVILSSIKSYTNIYLPELRKIPKVTGFILNFILLCKNLVIYR